MKLQTFASCKQPTVLAEITPETWIDEIKNGHSYKFLIDSAREDLDLNGKKPDGHYCKIKEGSLPTICWNFKFNGYKSSKNAVESTGYLYFDIDNNPSFDISLIDKNLVFVFFLSLFII